MGNYIGYSIISPCANCKKRRGYFSKRKRGTGITICRNCNLPYFHIATAEQRQKYGRRAA